MSTKTIDGAMYVRMLCGGAALLALHKNELNDLNVFPVADGDTGTNMLRTLEGGLAEVRELPTDSIGKTVSRFSQGVLLSARGNSGVILSQIFAGIGDVLKNYDSVNAQALAEAYENGIARSYASVQNPTEGTILTVFRESVEYAATKINSSSTVDEFFEYHIMQARRSLEGTKLLLPVLAQAGVVDSGGAGYLCIAEGMYQALSGKEIDYSPSKGSGEATVNISDFTRDSVLEYGYCTEALLRLTTSKVDPDTFDVSTVVKELTALGGESIVAYKQDDMVKLHVHTFLPGEVLAAVQRYGEFLTVKVENMNLGHSQVQSVADVADKPFSVVCVASGDGMSALFQQMGADFVVNGGQTSNPSTDDFLQAFRNCHSKSIIVLPNNKNILLAARQAAELYDAASVRIVDTANIAQGYAALSVITPGITDVDALVRSAENAAHSVVDGEITRAIRDAVIGDVEVRAGEYMGLSAGKLVCVSDTAESALTELLECVGADMYEIITMFVGRCVDDGCRADVTQRIESEWPDCELEVFCGDQDVYDYIVAIE